MGFTPGTGPKGRGRFNSTPSTTADFNQALDLINEFGNYAGAIEEWDRDAITGAALYDGLLIYNLTAGRLEIRHMNTWVPLFTVGTATATPTVANGWQIPSLNVVTGRDGWAHLTFNAIRTTTSSADATIVSIPAGFRTLTNHYGFGWGLLGGASSIQCWYDTSVHQIKMRQALSAGQSLALTMYWQIEA